LTFGSMPPVNFSQANMIERIEQASLYWLFVAFPGKSTCTCDGQ
jgi:hypothetical protein